MRIAVISLGLLLTTHGVTAPAEAASLTAVGGYDHYAGAAGQRTDGAVGALVLGVAGGDLMVAGVRYDDTTIGPGTSLTAGVGVPVGGAKLRIAGTRFLGDDAFRAWRAKIGPQLSLPGGRTLTLSYQRYQDNQSSHSNGAIAEATAPIMERLGAKASASYATVMEGPAAVQGSVGLSWSPIAHLELSGEVGAARNASAVAGQPIPGRQPIGGLPILGGGSSGGTGPSSIQEQVVRTVLVGVRVSLP
jgi:hypothetical protein